MSIQIAEISQRLQRALDQNYNVSDFFHFWFVFLHSNVHRINAQFSPQIDWQLTMLNAKLDAF